jgi:hypothetical protein
MFIMRLIVIARVVTLIEEGRIGPPDTFKYRFNFLNLPTYCDDAS